MPKFITVTAILGMGLGISGAQAQKVQPAKMKATVTQQKKAQQESVQAIADAYWDFYLRNYPEQATMLGEYKYNDQLSKYSVEHFAQQQKEAEALLQRIKAIPETALSEKEKLDRKLLFRTLSDRLEGLKLKTYEMPIDQFNGVHIALPQIATYAPFDTAEHTRQYISRLKQVPRVLQEVTALLEQGKRDGLMPPKFLLDQCVTQTHTISISEGAENPFAQPASHLPESIPDKERTALHDQILQVVDKEIRPAYAAFEKFLTTGYVPYGRKEPGIWALPQGDERYKLAVRLQTTTYYTPEQIHEIGLKEVERIEGEMEALAKQAGAKNRKAFAETLASDPSVYASSREQILNNYRRYIGQMNAKLPSLFGLQPKAKVLVRSVPEFMEKESSTQYLQGTADGARPGQIWVVTYDPTHHNMIDDEATAYHEGVPGHHMQISIAQELPGMHPFHRMLANDYNAYVEGWALYAERLGKDVGFYQDPKSDWGRLNSELFRAIRLVVDTGVHAKHWTRDQMVQYFQEHFYEVPQSEVDRYIAWPGQALGYKMGQLKILELREAAQKELGSSFDIKDFHDEVLNAGALPLDELDSRIRSWIKVRTTSH